MRWWLSPTLLVVLATAASCGDGNGASRFPAIDLSQTNTPVPLHQTGRGFIGDLGSFKVSWDGLSMPCEERIELPGSDPSTSNETDLWSDVFSSQATYVYCAGDRRLVAIVEQRDGLLFRRHSFYDLPVVVTFPGGEELPRLQEIEGHEAIMSGSAEQPKHASVYVIEREPSGDQPGVFVGVSAVTADFAAVQEMVEQLLQ